MKINKAFIHTIKGIAIGLVLVVGISYVQAAWAPPTGAPSEGNNAPAPINVSSSNQAKEGWLLVGGTGTPISALDVSNGTDTAQAVADMALVTKTSRFVQTLLEKLMFLVVRQKSMLVMVRLYYQPLLLKS